MQGHEPMTFIDRIAPRPLLMVIGEDDLCVPTSLQLAMFKKTQEPKRLHVIRGTGLFSTILRQQVRGEHPRATEVPK